MIDTHHINEVLKKAEMRVTPQRVAILEAMYELKTHPTAENIIEFIKTKHPNIAIGTVYKVIENFVEKGIVDKVKTDNGVMRYDAFTGNHHHLFCDDSQRIEDYYDDTLDEMLKKYFEKKQIPEFSIKNIRLEITGHFKNKKY